ncbi:MAG: hemerythrin domain-containing protein [Burkholderiales bacterium]|nr:hemerythrin domain-containing protein [Burkholderiales bacterium]
MTVLHAPPGFDDPLRFIQSAHVRIEQRTALLCELCKHVAAHGVDETSRKTADAVMRYFDEAPLLHHQDEEQDLFPRLLAAAPAKTRAGVERVLALLTAQHGEMDRLHAEVRPCLAAMREGQPVPLDAAICGRIHELYVEHIAIEEAEIMPLAEKLLSAAALAELGKSMAARRSRAG